MKLVSVKLPEEVDKRLSELAKRTGRGKSYYLREALLEHLDDIEDIYLAEKELEKIRAGRSKTHTAEEVRNHLLSV
ncbi:MAG: ribbon-helix-helix protein, CopG family [Nitrospinae bacterium]|nr:ribbon-helix-helix protein, CopG family [Nitrospinota bacterium]